MRIAAFKYNPSLRQALEELSIYLRQLISDATEKLDSAASSSDLVRVQQVLSEFEDYSDEKTLGEYVANLHHHFEQCQS